MTIVPSTSETKLRTLEETSRCVMPPGGSDDSGWKMTSPSLSILNTYGTFLDHIPIPLLGACLGDEKAGAGVYI